MLKGLKYNKIKSSGEKETFKSSNRTLYEQKFPFFFHYLFFYTEIYFYLKKIITLNIIDIIPFYMNKISRKIIKLMIITYKIHKFFFYKEMIIV